MSVEAIAWAFSVDIKPSSAKFVLVAMANNATAEAMLAWPSIKHLSEATGQDRKTVLASIAILVENGLIADTGRRAGATRQVVVYRLNKPKNGTVEQAKDTENGTVKQAQERDALELEQSQERDSLKGETVPFFPPNSTVFPMKQSQKRDTEPLGTNKEPKKKRATRATEPSKPDDVNEGVWSDFLQTRKAKRSPLTETALAGIRREAGKAGMSLTEALALCCERGWTSLRADWAGVQDHAAKRPAGSQMPRDWR